MTVDGSKSSTMRLPNEGCRSLGEFGVQGLGVLGGFRVKGSGWVYGSGFKLRVDRPS